MFRSEGCKVIGILNLFRSEGCKVTGVLNLFREDGCRAIGAPPVPPAALPRAVPRPWGVQRILPNRGLRGDAPQGELSQRTVLHCPALSCGQHGRSARAVSTGGQHGRPARAGQRLRGPGRAPGAVCARLSSPMVLAKPWPLPRKRSPNAPKMRAPSRDGRSCSLTR